VIRSPRVYSLLVAASLVVPGATRADPTPLESGISHYQKKEFTAARQELGTIVELGNADAQALYGVMLRNGDGGPADVAGAVGWMLAAADNGFKELRGQSAKLAAALAALPPDQRQSANDIVARFGRDGLLARLTPTLADTLPCTNSRPVAKFETVTAEYPYGARRISQNADVAVDLRVGRDGLVREPDVTGVFPVGSEFAAPSIQAMLRSRFRPATVDGAAVPASYRMNLAFRMLDGGTLWDDAAVRTAIAQAKAGNPGSEFLVGSAAILDPNEFGMRYMDALLTLHRAAQAGHVEAQYRLAKELALRSFCAPSAKADRWLTLAAAGGSARAQLMRARQLLQSAPGDSDRRDAKAMLLAVAQSGVTFARRIAIGILASTPFDDVRDPAAAAASMQATKDETYNRDPLTWEAYASAYAATGRFSDAARAERKAYEFASEYRWNTSAIVERLAAYDHHRAWRGDLFAVPDVPPPGPPPSRISPCRPDSFHVPCVSVDSAQANDSPSGR